MRSTLSSGPQPTVEIVNISVLNVSITAQLVVTRQVYILQLIIPRYLIEHRVEIDA